MTLDQIVEHYGSRQAAADALGTSRHALDQWATRGYVPELPQRRYAEITRGKLQVGPPMRATP